MLIKVSELEGAALDWAVAKCEKLPVRKDPMNIDGDYWIWSDMWPPVPGYARIGGKNNGYSPSTDWAQGGPIIERLNGLQVKSWLESKQGNRCEVHIHNYECDSIAFGPTPLIAAMRCYVASKLGDEIDIPKELVDASI